MAPDEGDIVERWAGLMEEWASASMELDLALAALSVNDPAALAGWQARVEDARRNQDQIKQEIDALITGAMAGRAPPSGGIIIGRLSRNDEADPSCVPGEGSRKKS